MKKLLKPAAITFVLLFTLLCGWKPVAVFADTEYLAKGTCGDLTWNLGTDKILKFSGSGNFAAFKSHLDPDSVEAVSFPAGMNEANINDLCSLTNQDMFKNFYVEEGNAFYKSIDGVLYSKDEKTLVAYPKGRQDSSFSIPDFVEAIDESAFNYSGYQYNGRSPLTDVTFSKNLRSIGPNAFSGCAFTSVKLPASISIIFGKAFHECKNLKEFIIEDSEQMDEYSRFGWFSVDGVLYSKSWNDEKGEITIEYYPPGRDAAEFQVPSGVTTIGWNAFSDLAGPDPRKIPFLNTLRLPVTVTRLLESDAFWRSGIKNFYFPSTLKLDLDRKMLWESEIDSVTFYGAKDSDAQRYAAKYGIKFVESKDPAYVNPEKQFLFKSLIQESDTGQAAVPAKEAGQKALKLSASTLTLKVKKSSNALQLKQSASGDSVLKWTSSKKAVVSVNAKTGLLKAKKAGTAVITVTMKSGALASCKVTVKK